MNDFSFLMMNASIYFLLDIWRYFFLHSEYLVYVSISLSLQQQHEFFSEIVCALI